MASRKQPPPPERPARREGRIRRHLRVAGAVSRDPKRLYPILRTLFVDAWRSRGGGFYGLGYAFAFFYFEVVTVIGEAAGSDSAGDFMASQLLEYLLRIGLLSFVNMFQALLWPFFVLDQLGWVGVILIGAGFAGFEYVFKPLVEQYVPELRAPTSRQADQ